MTVGSADSGRFALHLPEVPQIASVRQQNQSCGLAAGNRVIIKPSEHVPHFSALLKETVAERFDATELLITGVEDEVAEGFAHRSITSSSPGRPGWSGWSRRLRGAISRLSRSSSAASRPRSSMCQPISTRRPSASPRQVAQGWPDLHRAGLCAGAGARVAGLRRKGARADAAHVRHRSRQQGLHLDHFRPALRAAASGCRAPIRSPHR